MQKKENLMTLHFSLSYLNGLVQGLHFTGTTSKYIMITIHNINMTTKDVIWLVQNARKQLPDFDFWWYGFC